MRMQEMNFHFPYMLPELMESYTSPSNTFKSRPGRVKRVVTIPGYHPCDDPATKISTPVWSRCTTLSRIFDRDDDAMTDHRDVKGRDQDCLSHPIPSLIEERRGNDETDTETKAKAETETKTELKTTTENNQQADSASVVQQPETDENAVEEASNAKSGDPPLLDDGIIDTVCASFEIVIGEKNCDPTLLSERGRDQEWVWV